MPYEIQVYSRTPAKESNIIIVFLFKVILLSATMPAEVLEVTTKFMRDPIRIVVKKEELTLLTLWQNFVFFHLEVGHSDGHILLEQSVVSKNIYLILI